MKTFSYKVLPFNGVSNPDKIIMLNKQGADGWSLIEVDGGLAYLMKEEEITVVEKELGKVYGIKQKRKKSIWNKTKK